MPLNDRKIISIILEECEEIEERCDGYRQEIIEVISEILQYERSHKVSATNIQKKINGKLDAAARFLAKRREQNTISTEEAGS
ncbi:MAG: hypothetical protein M2R45_01417 [Verrucomicrobia subdivision 3 bacterium]|nr:hypothetical protein [Limisphaerales bacterium]MCS1415968.1 hypothetical protein [Limisphaerales bacterium]